GYYSLGLLNAWSLAGEHRHWMIPLRKGAQYEEIRKLGKGDHLLTSMTDAMRFPGGEMADLYSHRWEIELGYREIKQTMQLSR
ncbi:transposase, partial [Escherichia coli]|uniref:transposase n=1 Tax=Escherichia coli TaxID=562 RepID=UPI002238FB7B